MLFGPDSNNDGLPELYVTGWLSHSVVRYDGATGAPLGNYIPAGSGGLSFPFSLALRNNELFVTSAGTDQILKYDAGDGNYLGVAASAGLDYPRGLTFGPDDLMYVTSGDNDRILRFTPNGTYVDDYVPAGIAELDNPRTPRFGPDGDLYVTMTGNSEIMRFGDQNEALFVLTLSIPSNQPVAVDFSTSNMTAIAGSDYAESGGAVSFEPGVTSQTIVVPIVDDTDVELDETFFVDLTGVVGATILVPSAVGTIIDNEIGNEPPNVNAGGDQTLVDADATGSESVTLVGTVTDNDGTIESIEWTDGTSVLGNTATLTTTLAVGVHTLTLTAMDNDGATATDSVNVTVTSQNDADVLYVWDIEFDSRRRGRDYRILVDVRRDSDFDAVAEGTDASAAGVEVTVSFTDSSGNVQTFTGLTSSDGIFRSQWIKRLQPGEYRAEVVDLALAGFAWDPSDLLDATLNDEDFDGDGKPDDVLTN